MTYFCPLSTDESESALTKIKVSKIKIGHLLRFFFREVLHDRKTFITISSIKMEMIAKTKHLKLDQQHFSCVPAFKYIYWVVCSTTHALSPDALSPLLVLLVLVFLVMMGEVKL